MRDIPSCDKRNKLKVTDETKYLFYEINMTERQKRPVCGSDMTAETKRPGCGSDMTAVMSQ
jgi:hypothetical protein